jgi:hypothetical protein
MSTPATPLLSVTDQVTDRLLPGIITEYDAGEVIEIEGGVVSVATAGVGVAVGEAEGRAVGTAEPDFVVNTLRQTFEFG